jgi:hypothetical protein
MGEVGLIGTDSNLGALNRAARSMAMVGNSQVEAPAAEDSRGTPPTVSRKASRRISAMARR